MPDFEITSPDGKRFIVTAPEGASQDEVLAYAQKNMGGTPTQPQAAPQPGMAEQAAGLVGQFGAGANTSIARTIGGLPDLVGAGMRAGGQALGVPDQYLPKPDFFTNTVQSGINAVVGEPAAPQGTAQTLARGAGQGVADAAGVVLPAAAASRMAAFSGPMAQAVTQGLVASPGMQAASGAAAGAATAGTDNPLAGLAAGMAVPAAVSGAAGAFGRIAAPVRPNPNPAYQDALALAQQEGIAQHLTPGQQSGNQHLRRAETLMRYVPGNGPDAQNAGLMEAYQQALLRRAGSNADAPTDAVLDGLQQQQGQRIGDIMARNQLNLNPGTPEGMQTMQELADPLRRSRRLGIGNNADELLRQYGDLLGKVQNGGVVEGGAVRELRTRLKEMADGLEGSNTDLARYLRDMRGALTRGMERSMVATDAADWQDANRLYANIKVLRDAKSGTGQAAAGDQITPSQLSAALRRSVGSEGMASGRGDMHDLADMGKLLVEPSVKDSGTAGNTLVGKALFGGAAAGYSAVDPLTAAMAFGPTLAYRAASATGYLNPRQPPQIAQQMAQQVTPELLASVLAARGRAAVAAPSQQQQPVPNSALPAALLVR